MITDFIFGILIISIIGIFLLIQIIYPKFGFNLSKSYYKYLFGLEIKPNKYYTFIVRLISTLIFVLIVSIGIIYVSSFNNSLEVETELSDKKNTKEQEELFIRQSIRIFKEDNGIVIKNISDQQITINSIDFTTGQERGRVIRTNELTDITTPFNLINFTISKESPIALPANESVNLEVTENNLFEKNCKPPIESYPISSCDFSNVDYDYKISIEVAGKTYNGEI